MTKFMKGRVSFLIGLTIGSVLIFASCEDPGSIGGEFYDSSTVVIDTLDLEGFSTVSFNAYTGGADGALTALVGKVSDPLFGDFESRVLLKPNANRQAAIDRIDDSFVLKLRIQVDTTYVWGNKDENFGYTIYENTSFWRGAVLQSDDEVTFDNTSPIATFDQRDLSDGFYEVELSEAYSDKILDFYNNDDPVNDSLWNFTEFGLSIVPNTANNQVENLRFTASNLLVIDEFADDTASLIIQDWGFLYEQSNQPAYTEQTILQNSLDQVFRVDLNETINRIERDNIVSSELVFYEDTTQLNMSTGPQFSRPETFTLSAQVDLGQFPEVSLQFEDPAFRGFKDEDGAYRFDITFYVNDVFYAGFQGEDFYIYPSIPETGTRQRLGGYFTNTLLFNSDSPEFSPKLIIKSIVEEQQ